MKMTYRRGLRSKNFNVTTLRLNRSGLSANPVTMGVFRELKFSWCILFMICAPLQPPELLFLCERILNRSHHNTSDSLKASVVAGLADIKACRESKVSLGSR